MTRVLARNAEQVSASTAEHLAEDPFTRLQHVAAAYTHGLGEAAVAELGPDAMARIDPAPRPHCPALTASAAWPVLRQHLATLAIAGDDPLARLAAAIGDRELEQRRRSRRRAGLAPGPHRHLLGGHLAAALAARHPPGADRGAQMGMPATPPRPRRRTRGQDPPHRDRVDSHRRAGVGAAAAQCQPRPSRRDRGIPRHHRRSRGRPRIAGPEQYPVRTRAVQALLEQQAAAAIGRREADTSRWNTVLDDINPHIRRDSYYPQLAAHLATVARTGVDIRQLLTDAAQRGPLPDELAAAALRWRLARTLAPATIDTPSSGLRPAWMPDLHRVFGSTLAEAITADPAWPGLVAAVAAADRRRWTPLDLLTVAAEHLRDADPDEQLRPDEYARLLTYSIDLFTTEHPFSHDIPVPAEPPASPEEARSCATATPTHSTPAPTQTRCSTPPASPRTPHPPWPANLCRPTR